MRPRREVAQEAADPADALGVEAVHRLVEDQQAGRRVAPRRARAAGARRARSRPRGGAAASSPMSSSTSSTRPRAGCGGQPAQVVAPRRPGCEVSGVEQRADVAARRSTRSGGRRRARAAVGRVEPQDEPHGGRLAGAVAEEAGHAPRLDRERQSVDGEHVAVALAQVVHLDHAGEGTPGRAACRRAHERSSRSSLRGTSAASSWPTMQSLDRADLTPALGALPPIAALEAIVYTGVGRRVGRARRSR